MTNDADETVQIQLSLSPGLIKFIDEEIVLGPYTSRDEVVTEALRLLASIPRWTTETLKAKIDEGLKSLEEGRYVTVDDQGLHDLMEDIKRRGRERLTERNAQREQLLKQARARQEPKD